MLADRPLPQQIEAPDPSMILRHPTAACNTVQCRSSTATETLRSRRIPRYSGKYVSLLRNACVRRSLLLLTLVCIAGGGPLLAEQRAEAKQQVEFGIEVARHDLWREALYRWQRAVDIDPTYAAAFNNIAIAYERLGEFDKAREAYESAVELEPDNLMIQQNYDLFREINDRTSSSRDS